MATDSQKVDSFINRTKEGKSWIAEFEQLRAYILDVGLTEAFKWNHPCYTYNNKNVVLMHAFTDFCGISFFKGVLMQDPEGLLVAQTENMQSDRQLRFESLAQIHEREAVIKAYLVEAIDIEEKGLQVELKKTEDFDMPAELEEAFAQDPEFYEAFEELTPGRQRGYLLYFGDAKQAKTRIARIERYREKIFAGKGWNER